MSDSSWERWSAESCFPPPPLMNGVGTDSESLLVVKTDPVALEPETECAPAAPEVLLKIDSPIASFLLFILNPSLGTLAA